MVEEKIEEMGRDLVGGGSSKKPKSDSDLADYQRSLELSHNSIIDIVNQASEELDSLSPDPGTSKLVFQKKVEKLQKDIKLAKSNCNRKFRVISDEVNQKRQKALLFGGGENQEGTGMIRDRNVATLMEEKGYHDSSMKHTNDSINSGRAILASFGRQSVMMQSIRTRMMNMGEDLGKTNLMTRLIGERARQDSLLIVVLFCGTVFLILLFYCYKKGYF